MAQKTRLVIINVPDKKVTELERFLKNSKNNGLLARIQKSNGKSEIWKIGIDKQTDRKFKSNHYEVIIRGGNKKANKFIRSLFKNKLIPDGKQWQVLGPMLNNFFRQ